MSHLRSASSAERKLFGTMAAAIHAGLFGELLFENTATRPPIEPPSGTLASLDSKEQALLDGYFANKTATTVGSEISTNGKPVTMTNTAGKLRRRYGATTTQHVVRRATEVHGRNLLPRPTAEYTDQQDVARHFSPRHIVHLGMLSFGMPVRATEDLFGPYAGVTAESNVVTRITMRMPRRTTSEFVVAQALANGMIAPETMYLTPDYIRDAVDIMRQPDHELFVPDGLLPQGPYPWIRDTLA